MPPRRSHRKSRAGCKRCKLRKIKCDEVHPRCGNCVKHGVVCDFENPDVVEEILAAVTPLAAPTPQTPASIGSDLVSTSSSSVLFMNDSPTAGLNWAQTLDPALLSSPQPITIPIPINANTPPSPLLSLAAKASVSVINDTMIPTYPSVPALYKTPTTPELPLGGLGPNHRLLDMRLMHHYTTVTSKTLTISPTMIQDVWMNEVPRLAFNGAPYLADAILAVTALHMRVLGPYDRHLVQASHAYMASSVAQYCQALSEGINEANAEALFLTATLIALQSTATRVFTGDESGSDHSNSSSPYTLPLSWFHAFQGVKAVVASSWPWIRNSRTVLSVIDAQPALQLDMRTDSAFFGPVLEGLESEVNMDDPAQKEATLQAYHHAASVLNWAHSSSARGAALAFPASVSKRFVDLIEMRRPRALVLLASFFALLRRFDSIWWLQGVPRREIIGIASLFDRTSPWWKHLEWPLRIALHEGPVIPPDVWGSDWLAEENKQGGKAPKTTYVHQIEMMSPLLARNTLLPPIPPPPPQSTMPGAEDMSMDCP
ncbi:hypothetical protein CFIMG_004837RA [Ceratocystis fimbriata CBS 114723]|uniref:Zn(2)-C6 fungal-type domain-containing protein n=1 Tax=Ceratocystis fimbriata CBS 114723 TaxID=1035309 RepID=A0A2C5X4Z5_9PEZI|nr:hypothetical protein CFIMG_004837RA [Ceratocystis fimbriata CBS 114723]